MTTLFGALLEVAVAVEPLLPEEFELPQPAVTAAPVTRSATVLA
jgi:hypothetical protein